MKLRKIENFDLTRFEQAIYMMGEMKAHSIAKSETMFFDLHLKKWHSSRRKMYLILSLLVASWTLGSSLLKTRGLPS